MCAYLKYCFLQITLNSRCGMICVFHAECAFHFLANWRLRLAYNAFYLKFENANNVLLDQSHKEKKHFNGLATFYSVFHYTVLT